MKKFICLLTVIITMSIILACKDFDRSENAVVIQAEQSEVEYCWVKLEPDGDFEIILHAEGGGYNYIQVLGGEVVEARHLLDLSVFGERLAEFEYTEKA